MNGVSSSSGNGDSQQISAFEEIYRQEVDRVYRYLYFRLGNVEDAQDITTQTFIRLLEEGQQLTPDADFVDGLAQKFAKMPQVRQPTGKRWLFVGRPGRRFALAMVSLLLVICLSLLASPQTRAALLDMIYGMRMIDSQALESLAIDY